MNEHVAPVRACTDMEEYLFDLNGYVGILYLMTTAAAIFVRS